MGNHMGTRRLALVEGVSDVLAVNELGRRLGAADGLTVEEMGGAHAAGRVVATRIAAGWRADAVTVLVDAGEAEHVRRVVAEAASAVRVLVCDRDLEDELVRALGTDVVEVLLERHGDLRAFRTLQRQAPWAGRPVPDQLRRFFGAGASRKLRYAKIMASEVSLDAVPDVLRQLFAAGHPGSS